ncbi:MAG: HlyD family efflux transporter periplasmic adaptor subunit [Burkholderiales bacterium]|nr:MAG: HlyD family efflux transporter periplasmic adaptor subunit [Burkholderiales bacterium]
MIQLTRLSALQRDAASLQGQTGQLTAQMAQAEGKIAEIELQIIQLDEDQRSEVMKELREIQAKSGELVERRAAAADQLKRVDLRSPNTGVVHQLAVHTVGGVIQAGEPAMLIIPIEDDLQVEARVLPTDIDQITLGQSARAKVLAGQQSTNPELRGTVVRIAADVTRDDKQSPPFYSVRVALPKSEFERMGETKIIAGMQAEVFIETTVRTPLEYLMKPISDHLGRTFRER